MEISKTKFGLTIALTVLLTLTGSILALNPQVLKKPQAANIRCNVYYVYETLAFGKQNGESHNIITNGMERYVRNIIGFDNVTTINATQWIAMGNSSITAAHTKLDTEATSLGFTRAANDSCVAWMNGTDYAYNVTNMFTATGTIRVNATACHYQSTSDSSNNIAALASITATTFETDDNCTIVWVWTIDGN